MIIASLLFITACGKDQSSRSQIEAQLQKTNNQITFIHGPPDNIIAGATFNKVAFFNNSNEQRYNGYILNSINQFTEKDIIIEKEDTNIEAGNEAETEDTTKKNNKISYQFVDNGDGTAKYFSEQIDLTFHFIKIENSYFLNQLETKSFVYEIKALHYSESKNNNATSILIETKDNENGKVLLSFTFNKDGIEKETNYVNSYYKYTNGPGVAIGWDQKVDLNIDICGSNNNLELSNKIKSGINSWKNNLKNRLNINVNSPLTYPPFSDLNSHCIYLVSDYQTEYGNDVANPGTTFSIVDKVNKSIVDSDIILWEKEIKKFGTNILDYPRLERTISHEFGHLLGLDHQFDKYVSSIMSYNPYDLYLTNYDISAVQILYPIQTTPQ